METRTLAAAERGLSLTRHATRNFSGQLAGDPTGIKNERLIIGDLNFPKERQEARRHRSTGTTGSEDGTPVRRRGGENLFSGQCGCMCTTHSRQRSA